MLVNQDFRKYFMLFPSFYNDGFCRVMKYWIDSGIRLEERCNNKALFTYDKGLNKTMK